MKERENFTGKFGFVISCVGAALGLGNIWLFILVPIWRCCFLDTILFICFYTYSCSITEFSFGRRFKAGSYTGIVESFKSKSLKGGKFFEMLPPRGLNRSFYILLYSNMLLKYFF